MLDTGSFKQPAFLKPFADIVLPKLKQTRSPSIRSRLALLAMACIVPAAVMAAVLIFYGYHQARRHLIHDAISTAHAMVLLTDKELASVESSLLALATSPHLTANDLSAFYDQAKNFLQSSENTNIVLSDAAGNQYINTLRPFGPIIPPSSAFRQLQSVAKTRKTVITNLFIGRTTGRPLIVVGVPVLRNDRFLYNLSAGIFVERFGKLLSQQNFPSEWVSAIFDRNGTLVAGTDDMNRFIGMRAAPKLLSNMAETQEGTVEDTTINGQPMLAVFSHSAISGWTVTIGVPTSTLRAELWNRFYWLILVMMALLGISLGLAWVIGGRIAQAVRGLAAPALALGSGRVVQVTALHLREADEVGAALARASEMLRHAQHQMNHDGLTGLANRTLFQEIVNQQLALCQRTQFRLSVLYIDLDGFKSVNDSFGHAMGDKLLCIVAERLLAGIRESDVAARLGGDEFAVLLINAAMEDAEAVATKLVETLSMPYQIDKVTLEISASIGVACFPEAGISSKALLHHADDAMYRAKAMGKRRVVMAAK